VDNPNHVCCGVVRLEVDGVEYPLVNGDSRPYALVPQGQVGDIHTVKVTMGETG